MNYSEVIKKSVEANNGRALQGLMDLVVARPLKPARCLAGRGSNADRACLALGLIRHWPVTFVD